MFRKEIRTAAEEAGGLFYTLLFSAVWYVSIFQVVFRGGFQPVLILFLLAGLLPLEAALRQFRRARNARAIHQRALAEITPFPGTIRAVQRAAVPVSHSRGRVSYAWQYQLQVEFQVPGDPAPRQITSEPYRMPISNYLASTEVDVYPLPDGWHFVLDGFHRKENPRDPGPFPMMEHSYGSFLARLIFVLFLLYILFQILRGA